MCYFNVILSYFLTNRRLGLRVSMVFEAGISNVYEHSFKIDIDMCKKI